MAFYESARLRWLFTAPCVWAFLVLLAQHLVGTTAEAASIRPVQQVEILSEHASTPERVNLPYFFQQKQSGLSHVRWQFEMPEDLAQQPLPSLLLPQPVQGLSVWYRGQKIYEIPASDEATWHNAYHPLLITLPPTLLKAGERRIEVRQTGHLRGWFISPILTGDLQDLRPLEQAYRLLSNTLPVTSNLICAAVGLLLLLIGYSTRQATLTYGGATTLVWSVLFSLALVDTISQSQWTLWRASLYALTGNLIWCLCMFTGHIFSHPFEKRLAYVLLAVANLGWICLVAFGKGAEPWLDQIWTLLIILAYVVVTVYLLARAWLKKQWKKIIPIGLQWLLTSALALHDYVLQAGPLPALNIPPGSDTLATALWLQPIYVTHLALPLFAAIAIWLLTQDHLQKNRQQNAYASQLQEQRERILGDLHDGVGARLNLLLWSLQTHAIQAPQIEQEIQRCLDELRFAINPPEANALHLHSALNKLCHRYKHVHGPEIELDSEGSSQAISPEIGIQIYKTAIECLSNAIRHARCTRIQMQLKIRQGQLRFCVQDNGAGIPHWNSELQQQTVLSSQSLGLKSLRLRIQKMNGTVSIHSGTAGTCIDIRIPV